MKNFTFNFLDAANYRVSATIDTERGYFSMCGDYGMGAGQIFDHVLPRTDAQRRLIDFWKEHHLSALDMESTGIMEEIVRCVICEEEERKQEEEEQSLYDVNDDSEDLVEYVQFMHDCERHDALCMIALARELGMSLHEMDDICGSDSEYTAEGIDFYVDDSDALDALAREQMKNDDDCYLECWIDAVKNQGERRGFDDWCDYVVDMDGWCSILNHWDGRYNEQQVCGEWICVSRR